VVVSAWPSALGLIASGCAATFVSASGDGAIVPPRTPLAPSTFGPPSIRQR